MPYPVGTPPVFRQRAELETSHQECHPTSDVRGAGQGNYGTSIRLLTS